MGPIRSLSLVLLVLLFTASSAIAGNNSNNSDTSTGGTSTASSTAAANANAIATGIGQGGDARSTLDADIRVYGGSLTNVSPSSATAVGVGGSAKQGQTQGNVGINGQGQSTTVQDNSVYNETDGRQLRKAAERHADTAPNATATSAGAPGPCGDTVGLSGQVGVGGVGLGTITETCRAYRLNAQQELYPESAATKLATFSHYTTYPFRLVLTIATFGLLG